ncbi:MAG TPA: exonuclease domain-containing protein [Casimicrobiaceae bacterium]|nr:exonuclease domain-containing protein [Casimicrobiaceae bacterium]
MFPRPIAIVDLETTGTHAGGDRITEIGIVRAEPCDGSWHCVDQWCSLVDPEMPIPPAIQVLTGITDAMVRGAPCFAALADEVAQRLADCVFVAHNARFDFAFLKNAFARLDRSFTARVLCTVRLSRRLFPEAEGHALDALIARHGLPTEQRHRALGDARAVWSFVQALYRELPGEQVDAAIKRILRIPSLPPRLPPDAIDALPESPGVYLFYGDNPLPLYIGKSINLRERVGAHFCSDWRSETDLRLSQEIRRIEHEPCAGELGALLREAALVKTLLPAHNRALRRKTEAGVLKLEGGLPRFVCMHLLAAGELDHSHGPFASRAAARACLRDLARDHELCWLRIGLERRPQGPCFARQLKRCRGVCVGEESVADHDARLAAALAARAIPPWPWPGAALIRESSPEADRIDVHVIRQWSWQGTARDDEELQRLLEAPMRSEPDVDVTRLLLRRYATRPSDFIDARKAAACPRDASSGIDAMHA